MAKISHEIWSINKVEIPVRIYRERRRNNRISIGKNTVNLRVSMWDTKRSEEELKSWAHQWLQEQIEENPQILARFESKRYENNTTVKTHYHEYQIFMTRSVRVTSVARMEDDCIMIDLDDRMTPREESKAITSLIARMIGKREKPRIAKRVQELNQRYFGNLPISGIFLKNNTSNWGSCSSKGNINIATRALMAPPFVQDYIIIHELAHRIEMNHSPSYWKIVASVMPEYKEAEKWLKVHGGKCRF